MMGGADAGTQAEVDAGPDVGADAGSWVPLPDPTQSSDWRQERAGGDTADTIAVSPRGRVWIAGRLGLLAERREDGVWVRPDLDALLLPYAEPRGEWQQFLFEGDDVWVVGALGFYNGGVVRRHAGSWTIEYDEARDSVPMVLGGPFPHLVRAADGSLVLPIGGTLVRRVDGEPWRVVPPSDAQAALSTTVATENGRVVGVGPSVFELEDAAMGRWRRRGATTPRGVYVRSAALVGERLYAVGESTGEGVAFSGTLDSLVATEVASRLFGVAVLEGEDVWAVGEAGLVLRHDGTAWRRVPGPPGTLVSVARTRAALFVVTADGAVYRYQP